MPLNLKAAVKRIVWTLVLLSGWTVCHGSGAPIKIGFVGDFTSVSKDYTHNAYKAAMMAVKEFNAQGGALGRSIELIHRDGGNDPDQHARHIADLVRQDKIVAVFGGASSPCVLKASAECRALEIPYLVSIGNAQSIAARARGG